MKPTTAGEFSAAVADVLTGAPRKPVRRDGPGGRFYTIEPGVSYPSVTHILQVIGKPALINWAANTERALVMDAAADLYLDLAKTPPMSRPAYVVTLQGRLGKVKAHKREMDKAAEIGTQAHELIEWNIRRALDQKVGPEPRVVDAAQWAFMAFSDWAGKVNLKPTFIEQTVFSREYGYAGTMDLLAEVNGQKTLVDFKTSKAVYNEAHLQTAAYRYALKEMGHIESDVPGLILRLPKLETDPEFEVVESPATADLMPTFAAVIQLWKWWYAGEQAYRARRAEAVA
jgi:hypothetical protein